VTALQGLAALEQEEEAQQANHANTPNHTAAQGTPDPPDQLGWARHPPSAALPHAAGPYTAPMWLGLDAPGVTCRARGWKTRGGHIKLDGPARAKVRPSKAFTRLVLSRLNPLLADAVHVRVAGEGAEVEVAGMPVGGVAPAAAVDVEVGGVTAVAGAAGVAAAAVEVLRLADRRGSCFLFLYISTLVYPLFTSVAAYSPAIPAAISISHAASKK
jgi:hypothetical protein